MPDRSLLLDAVNADVEPGPTPGYVVAAFAPLSAVCVGFDLTREHAVCLDAYRHACGLPAWLDQDPAPTAVTAAEVNRAVFWWNGWHETAVGR